MQNEFRFERGGAQPFFCGCVPRGFQNVGSGERIFLENWGSRERKLGNFDLGLES